jgi:hypothetical protein
MNGNITVLLNTPDNIEKIRDNITAILKLECLSQYEKAVNQNVSDAQDYNINIYLERERPWQLTEDGEGNSPFPLVNVRLLGYRREGEPGDTVNRKKYIGEFAIDCYAKGQPDNPDYFDDTDAALRACKLGRIIRNILMSGYYTYMGMRDIVRRREITEAAIGSPTNISGNIDDSAISVTIFRILMSVYFFEDSPQSQGVEFQGISFKASSPDGKVNLVNI